MRNLMQIPYWFVLVWLTCSIYTQAAEPQEIILWPKGLPAGAKALSDEQIAKLKAAPVDPERIGLVESPSLVVYRAEAKLANGCAMVVCPGGAYARLAWVK